MKRIAITALVVATTTIIFTHAAEAKTGLIEKQLEPAKESYVPGMGEIMGATQMRHAKLWFTGNARNWELASYELDEIKEGLGDAVKFHPVFKGAPVSAMLDKYTAQPLSDIGKAVEGKDSVKFTRAFDRLTGACNACHQAANQGFIVIKRPGISSFSNQVFSAKAK